MGSGALWKTGKHLDGTSIHFIMHTHIYNLGLFRFADKQTGLCLGDNMKLNKIIWETTHKQQPKLLTEQDSGTA